MTLNSVMVLIVLYFAEFSKPAFQNNRFLKHGIYLSTKSASITHRAVKSVCVTKFTHSRVEWILALLAFYLSFKFRFTVVLFDVMLGFRFTSNTVIGHVCGEICAGVYCIL